MTVVVKGAEEVAAAIKAASKRYTDGIGTALYKAGATILAEAIKRAPVEFGTLRRSGYVSLPYPKERPRVEAGFGVKYAARQEMEDSYQHPRGGEAHYLRNAIAATSSGLAEKIAGWAKDAASGGTKIQATYPARPPAAAGEHRAKFKRGVSNQRARLSRK